MRAPAATVTVRARPERPVATLELRGELPHWSAAHAMTPAGDGFEVALPLAPGVYPVKAHAPDGSWWVDPAWRTARDGDELNGVISVGGTVEPVLHAPAPPWIDRRGDGAVIVRASLRRGAGRRLSVRVDDGAGAVVRPMRVVDGDDLHVHLEAVLPGAGRRLDYAFVVDDGRTVGGADGAWLQVDLSTLPPAPPPWWRDAVVYTVFVDRFRRGAGGWSGAGRWDRDHVAGGDLDGVVAALPYLTDLGVDALHLTPITPARSPHRYDAVDPRAVDAALGGEAGFERLLAAAHAAGVRVLVDLAVTHVHRDFAPFQDVLARGPASPWWSWFRVHQWPCFDGPAPGYDHYHHGQWQEPLLALDEPAVADWVVETFAAWARRGVDGVRIDAAADVPVALIARVRAAVRAAAPDAAVVGEVVPAAVDRYAPAALDAGTDFAAREALVGWLAGRTTAAQVAGVWRRQRRRGLAGPRGLGFVGTHDQPRIATVTDRARARVGLLAVALGARVPLLYYGDEVGLAAGAEAAGRAFEDSWPDRQEMPWDEAAWDATTREVVRAALRLRKEREVLRVGDEDVGADGDVVIVRRSRGDDAIDVVLHAGDGEVEVALPAGDGAAVLLAVGGARLVDRGGPRVRLPAASALVVDRRAPAAPHGEQLVARNAELAAQAFVDGLVVVPTYPARLYLTVTEACNLRCRHCITDAPARTSSGRARTLAPWLLDALADAFAHADYVGFTHGGEALASPMLPAVLRRIATARARRPGRQDVHVATNGMVLTPERLRALVDLGVTSLMVSLDGATAAANDHIRVLGKLDTVLAHVEAALAWRAQAGVDLRIGVSTVVGRTNVGELARLGTLCARLGVDWLKVEETAVVNAFSRADALGIEDAALVDAMDDLRVAVDGTGLVVVDHLAPPAGCPCAAEADAARAIFRATDDYANRARFRPCRAAWEQAAIDPDGTVHLVDYAGPALGNLLDAPLLDLWNTRAAVSARAAALQASPPSQRQRCVLQQRR